MSTDKSPTQRVEDATGTASHASMVNPHCLVVPLTFARELAAELEREQEWRRRVIDGLVCNHIYRDEHDNNPLRALTDLVAWECKIALDPAVSEDAQKLRDTYKAELERAHADLAAEKARNVELIEESLEQARLLGKSGSREAALLAELERTRADLKDALSCAKAEAMTADDARAERDNIAGLLECQRADISQRDERIAKLQAENAALRKALNEIRRKAVVDFGVRDSTRILGHMAADALRESNAAMKQTEGKR